MRLADGTPTSCGATHAPAAAHTANANASCRCLTLGRRMSGPHQRVCPTDARSSHTRHKTPGRPTCVPRCPSVWRMTLRPWSRALALRATLILIWANASVRIVVRAGTRRLETHTHGLPRPTVPTHPPTQPSPCPPGRRFRKSTSPAPTSTRSAAAATRCLATGRSTSSGSGQSVLVGRDAVSHNN